MSDFHFIRPWWLLALPLLALALVHRYRRPAAGSDWQQLCDPGLLPHILVGNPGRTARRFLSLAGLCAALAIFALAGPAWERMPAPAFRNLSALVIVLDLSYAMDAADFKPNRLDRVRYTIGDILRERKDGQSALVVYAGDAFTVTPLTDDAATITAQLSALSPGLMPVQGARPDLGLETAGRLLRQAALKSGDILLVISGEGADKAPGPIRDLKNEGFRVSVLAAGTSEGAPIPLAEGGFLKDQRGNIVVPRMDEAALKKLAHTGTGLFRVLGSAGGDPHGLAEFFGDRAEAEAKAGTGSTAHIEQWEEAGVWLLPLLLPLGALLFRRGWLALAAGLAILPTPEPACALDVNEWFATPDQRAEERLRSGNAAEAAKQFQDPAWKAAAEYQAGHYAEAASAWQGMDTATARYNRGNALARQGRYDEALADYRRAAELNSAGPSADAKLAEDTEHNRKLVEQAMEKQKQQQKAGGSGEKKQGDPKDGNGEKGQPSQGDGQSGDQKQNADGQNSGQDPQDSKQGQNSGQSQEQDKKDGRSQPEKDETGRQGEEKSASGGRDNQEKGKGQDQTIQPESAEEGDGKKDDGARAGAAERDKPGDAETRQAEAQWLRRIPDDPGGLLKRKFEYQYRLRQKAQAAEQDPW